MLPPTDAFMVSRCLRLPGLGLLVLSALPAPAWLASADLHTALALQLHRPGQPPLAVTATSEELTVENEPPTRALLLEADLGDLLPPDTWLAREPVGC